MKKRPIDKLSYYEWFTSRWLTSMTRLTSDSETRGVYRDLLDVCYDSGYIPADVGGLAAVAMCPADVIERVWPKIKRHFYVDKNDHTRMRSKFADAYRNDYFSYVRKQRQKAKERADAKRENPSIDNPNDSSDVDRLATGELIASGELAGDNTTRHDTTRYDTKQNETKCERWFREEFWPIVWSKTGVGAARAVFCKKAKTEEIKNRIVEAAKLQGPGILERGMRPGNTILHPRTWLSEERYYDEKPDLTKAAANGIGNHAVVQAREDVPKEWQAPWELQS